MSLHVRASFVGPEKLGVAPGWLPTYFSGACALALGAGATGPSIDQLGGQVLEGWRVSIDPSALAYDARAAATPIYRQANIGRLRLLLETQHWESPQIQGRWCVQPDDIVVNKLAPVRAAFVSSSARRHPVDGNTVIVRGLSRNVAAWTALCLNHPGYEQLLLLNSGVLQRVGLGALSSLHVPPAPTQMERLSARLGAALDDQLLAGEALHRVRTEASEATTAAAAHARPLGEGAFFPPDAVSHENWLPSATALRAEQATLVDDLGWTAIDKLALMSERERLVHVPEGARALRLRDVSDDLFVAVADDTHDDLMPSRTLGKPLVAGEVLISTLGSSFRAAYVDAEVPPNTFAADGWARLRFRETPAAWALMLSTDALRSQASRLAVGTAQQFVPPEALRALRVPVPPREVRDRWQRAVERHHAQRRAQTRTWSALLAELNAAFDEVHRPFADKRSRVKEVR